MRCRACPPLVFFILACLTLACWPGARSFAQSTDNRVFHYSLGDGDVLLASHDNYTTVQFSGAITPDNIRITADTKRMDSYGVTDVTEDMYIHLPDNAVMTIEDWQRHPIFWPIRYGLGEGALSFPDGSSWHFPQVVAHTELTGTDGADRIDLTDSPAMIGVRGGKGDDVFRMGAAVYRYYYDLGDGNDHIHVGLSGNPNVIYLGVNTLYFGEGIRPESIRVTANTQKMFITLADGAVITINTWQLKEADIEHPTAFTAQEVNAFFTRRSMLINRFVFSDGTIWDTADILRTMPLINALKINEQGYWVYPFAAGQDPRGDGHIPRDGRSLHLNGNVWTQVAINYFITPNTILEFDFSSRQEGEWHGVGFDNDLVQDVSQNGFKLFGTEADGIQNFDTYATLGQVSHYQIPVGQFLSGAYRYLYFFNDHDIATPNAQSTFSNIRLYDEDKANEPPSVAITSPVNGLVSSVGDNILMQVNASDADGTIQQVEFFVNQISAGISTEAPFALNWPARALGEYTLSAIATDNNGSQTTSNAVVISVQSDSTPNLPPEVRDVPLNVDSSSALIQIDLAPYIADDTGVDWQTLVISASNYGVVRRLSLDSGLIELDYRNANFSGEERLTYSVTDLQGLPSNQGKLIITVDVSAKPATPTDFIGVLDEQARSISLSWQYGQTDAVFTVQYKKLEEPSWHTLIDSTQSRQSALPRPLNGTYVFNLKACKAGQASQCSDLVESAAIVVNLAPEAVSNVEATVSANGQVSVQWVQVVDSTHYQVYQRINEGEAVMLNGNVSTTPYLFTLNQADVNGTYQFGVAACNGKGCSTVVYSVPTTVVLTPAKSEVVTYAEQGDPAYLLAWSQVELADYYQVQRQDNQGAWQDYIVNQTEPRLTVPPQAEFKQAFQVAACNIFGCSDYVVAEHQTQGGVINLISGFYTDAQILAQPQTPSTLHWQTQGATSVRLELVNDDQTTLVKGNLPANGSFEVTPSQSSNYRLVATNNTGESQQSDIRVVVKATSVSRWQITDENHLTVVPSSILVAADGSRFFGDLEGTLHRVGATAWQAEEIGLISSPPLQVGNWLYVSANNSDGQGVVYRLNASTGQERVAVTLPGSLVASPIVRNDGVLLITSEGEIYQFAAGLNNAPIPIRIITLHEGEQIRSTPVLSGELLYVRSNQSRLFKLNLATTEASATLGEGQVDANEWIIELKEGQ